ncbi:hypothetical protein [Ensifer adhaerens]|uniref:Uncharacterized protein n=1 Tax=Ensifer adhaerens TaxID=106592 RepID=A0ABY8HEB5_ENSAD|nr:hypothetical protein [Ensifer adhaerens]WFP89829.1 hypothetical protein P4B07_14845 [Ensifer adhaerens]
MELNKLHESFVVIISDKPRLAILQLETDNGRVEVEVNETVAQILADEMQKFLAPKN